MLCSAMTKKKVRINNSVQLCDFRYIVCKRKKMKFFYGNSIRFGVCDEMIKLLCFFFVDDDKFNSLFRFYFISLVNICSFITLMFNGT